MDIITILLMLIIGHILVYVLLFAYSRQKNNYTIQLTLNSQLVIILAYVGLYIRSIYPTVFLIILANSLLIAGMGMQAAALLNGIDQWNKRVRNWYIGLLSLSMTGFYSYVLTQNHEALRIVIITAITLGILLYPTYRLIKENNKSLFRSLLGGVYALTILAFLIRIIQAMMLGSSMAFLSPSAGNSLAFITLYALMLIGGVGILLLIKEKDDLRLIESATRDALTGIYNRSFMIEECDKLINLHLRKEMPIGMMEIDIDYFKAVNDTFGHAVGDKVLVEFASKISEILRPYDLFGRIGGEEFIVLLPNTSSTESQMIAERIRTEVSKMSIQNMGITVSIGLVDLIPTRETGFNVMYKAADDALYQAKNEGRNRVSVAH